MARRLVGECHFTFRMDEDRQQEDHKPTVSTYFLGDSSDGKSSKSLSLDSATANQISKLSEYTKPGLELKARELDPEFISERLAAQAARAAQGPLLDDALAVLEGRPEIDAVGGRLGSGSSSEVFCCTMKDSQRQVAVKVVHRGSDTSRKREVELLGQLRHANLVQLHGVLPGPPDALVLELCCGGSLGALLHGDGAQAGGLDWLGIGPRAGAMADVASAVQYLHESGIVHRDIKSGNAFLSAAVPLPAERLPPVKLGDLGLARELGPEMTRCTGTWRYMAPEVLKSRDYAEPSDVFSCGILLYEIMSGNVPFGKVNPVCVAVAIQAGRRPDPDDIQGLGPLPDTLGPLMRGCWATEPGERPTAAGLVESLLPLAVGR